MKCAKCGAEIKAGNIYCSRCGYEIQIVPDYNLLEDELLLKDIPVKRHEPTKNLGGTARPEVKRSSRPVPPGTNTAYTNRPNPNAVKRRAEQPSRNDRYDRERVNDRPPVRYHERPEEKPKKKNSRMGLIIGITIAGVTIACILMYLLMSYNNKHSFTYQFNQGLAYEASGDYKNALSSLLEAKEMDSENLDVRFEIADVYLAMDQTDKAISTLSDILDLDSSNKKAYKKLIAIYEEEGDYDSIISLYKTVDNDNIKNLFSNYLVSEPVFSKKDGTYDEKLKISITSSDNAKIYYTIDGSSPEDYGTLYEEPIEFSEEGDFEIKAICESENGMKSNVVTGEYTIEYTAPDKPTIIPESGNYSGPGQTITTQVPAGCNAYYIWNNPEDSSGWTKEDIVSKCTMYIEPIPMAEGNNILEVFTVSPKGSASGPAKFSYIYTP